MRIISTHKLHIETLCYKKGKEWSNKMKKLKFYLLYLLQLLIIGVFILVLLGAYIQMGKKNYFENEMFTENVKGLQISSLQSNEDGGLSIPILMNQDYMLYRYIPIVGEGAIRGVFGTSDVFGFSAFLKEGRFFNEDDYNTKTMTAVIGQDMIKETLQHDGKRYYLYNHAEYEVIGVFAKQRNIADQMVFLNLTALDQDIGPKDGIYFVDAKEQDTVDTVVEALRAENEVRFTFANIEFVPSTTWMLGNNFTTLFIFGTISVALCLVINTIFLIDGQRYSIAVRKLCGMTKPDLFGYYGKIMAGITIAAFVLIIIAMRIFTSLMPDSVFSNTSLNGWHYLVTGIILVVIGLCNTYYITRLSSDVDISSVLKGI